MAPSLEATPTVTALEARETRFYYNNGRCGDKTIYVCRPGIIFGMLGAIIIGLSVLFYACYSYRNTVSLYIVKLASLLPWCIINLDADHWHAPSK